MYTIQYTAHAIKDIKKLPPEVGKRIFDAINGIKEDPVPLQKFSSCTLRL